MNVQMPDGAVITDVPEGTTQGQLLERYQRYKAPKPTGPKPTTALQAGVGHAATAIAPGAAFLAGAGAGAPAASALAPESGLLSLALPLLTGVGASGLASYGQGELLKRYMPETYAKLAQEQQEHPVASQVGSVAGSLPLFGVGGLTKDIPAAFKGAPDAIKAIIGKALLGGATTAGQQLVFDKDHQLNVPDILKSMAEMQIYGRPTGVGETAETFGKTMGEKFFPPKPNLPVAEEASPRVPPIAGAEPTTPQKPTAVIQPQVSQTPQPLPLSMISLGDTIELGGKQMVVTKSDDPSFIRAAPPGEKERSIGRSAPGLKLVEKAPAPPTPISAPPPPETGGPAGRALSTQPTPSTTETIQPSQEASPAGQTPKPLGATTASPSAGGLEFTNEKPLQVLAAVRDPKDLTKYNVGAIHEDARAEQGRPEVTKKERNTPDHGYEVTWVNSAGVETRKQFVTRPEMAKLQKQFPDLKVPGTKPSPPDQPHSDETKNLATRKPVSETKPSEIDKKVKPLTGTRFRLAHEFGMGEEAARALPTNQLAKTLKAKIAEKTPPPTKQEQPLVQKAEGQVPAEDKPTAKVISQGGGVNFEQGSYNYLHNLFHSIIDEGLAADPDYAARLQEVQEKHAQISSKEGTDLLKARKLAFIVQKNRLDTRDVGDIVKQILPPPKELPPTPTTPSTAPETASEKGVAPGGQGAPPSVRGSPGGKKTPMLEEIQKDIEADKPQNKIVKARARLQEIDKELAPYYELEKQGRIPTDEQGSRFNELFTEQDLLQKRIKRWEGQSGSVISEPLERASEVVENVKTKAKKVILAIKNRRSDLNMEQSQLRDGITRATRNEGATLQRRGNVYSVSPEDRSLAILADAIAHKTTVDKFLERIDPEAEAERASFEKAAEYEKDPKMVERANGLLKVMHEQFLRDKLNGLDYEERPGYIHYVSELEEDPDAPFGAGKPQGGGKAGAFKVRQSEDIADYVNRTYKMGRKPVLEVPEIFRRRGEASGFQVAKNEVVQQARELRTPFTNKPLVMSVKAAAKNKRVGADYQLVPGFSQHWMVHKEFSPLFEQLYGGLKPSATLDILAAGSRIQKETGIFVGSYHLMLQELLGETSRLPGSRKFGYSFEDFIGGKKLPVPKLGKVLYDMLPEEVEAGVKDGSIPEPLAAIYRKERPILDDMMKKGGLAIDRVSDQMSKELVDNVPGFGPTIKGARDFIFGPQMKSFLSESSLKFFHNNEKLHPDWDYDKNIMESSREANQRFLQMGRRGIFKSPDGLRLAHILSFAWSMFEAPIRNEVEGYSQALNAPRDLVNYKTMGNLVKSQLAAVAALYVANQLINLGTRGKFTWENPESEEKFNAYIPPLTKGGQPHFISPFSVLFSITQVVTKAIENGTPAVDASAQFLKGRASVWSQLALQGLTGKTPEGRPTAGIPGGQVKSLVQTGLTSFEPFVAKTYFDKGDIDRQLTAQLGFRSAPQARPGSEVSMGRERSALYDQASFIAGRAIQQTPNEETGKLDYSFDPDKAEEMIKEFPDEQQDQLRKWVYEQARSRVKGRYRIQGQSEALVGQH